MECLTRFRDLIETGMLADFECEVVHYNDGDGPYATVCDLSMKDFTKEGLAEWKDVLDAPASIRMHDLYGPIIYLWMENTEEAMDRVRDFTVSLGAGDMRWFTI